MHNFGYRGHDRATWEQPSVYRVWVHGWPGDTFNLMSKADFEAFQQQLSLFGIQCIDHDELDDASTDGFVTWGESHPYL